VRFDAAARSLKHDWLERGVTGLQILVTSEAPDAQALAAESGAALVAAPQRLPSPRNARNAATVLRPRRRSWLPALLGLALAASAALLFFALFRPSTPAAAEGRGPSVVPARAVVSPPPVAEAPSVNAQVVAEPSAVLVGAPPTAAPVVTSAATKSRTLARGAGSWPSATRVTTPRPAPPRKGLKEFGF
jgi:hypothetical protein